MQLIPVHLFPSKIKINFKAIEKKKYNSDIILPSKLVKAHYKKREEFISKKLLLIEMFDSKYLSLFNNTNGNIIWPKGWIGSLSHKDKWVIAAIKKDKKSVLGVDIEKKISDFRKFRISKKMMTKNELIEFGYKKADLIFSLKESFYKALYPIIKEWFSFKDVECVYMKNGISKLIFLKKMSNIKKFSEWTGYYKYNSYYVLTGVYDSISNSSSMSFSVKPPCILPPSSISDDKFLFFD